MEITAELSIMEDFALINIGILLLNGADGNNCRTLNRGRFYFNKYWNFTFKWCGWRDSNSHASRH
jgi:hypothetical protein